jgi:hypothetical protein
MGWGRKVSRGERHHKEVEEGGCLVVEEGRAKILKGVREGAWVMVSRRRESHG